MKLLMISGFGASSLEKRGAFYNTLEELHKYWERIDILSTGSRWNFSQQREQVFFGNVFVHHSTVPLILQPFFILSRGKNLIQTQRHNLMTVHEYPPFYNGIGALVLHMWTKIPYVLEIMHIPGYPRAGSPKERFYRFLMSLFLRFDARKAKKVRTINLHETPEFLIKAGIPEEKLFYAPAFYIDLNVFKPQDISKKYDVIFVGRLTKNKGIFLLLDALRRNHHSAIIVGAGPEKDEIGNYIQNNGLADAVTIHGWAKDSAEIARLINQSRVLVMPSYNEGGPRVVLESMACGVPVVATRVGIVHDTITHGESGLVVPWDGAAISSAIEKLIADPGLYMRIRSRGLEVVQKFERTTSIQKLAAIFQSII